ncbi:hypothetical protein QYF36_021763 [Acer negundo]|nr:hypothetical protein QYF36_021763 [Acer negundo]
MIKVVCRIPEKIRDKICCKGRCVVAATVDIEATVEVVAVSTTSMKTIHKEITEVIDSPTGVDLFKPIGGDRQSSQVAGEIIEDLLLVGGDMISSNK